ncbi:uncharacterized protein N7511_002116 [Penicillium nucicola]|uniref:uncharacterized protein n=1 Tax=Penicillium nucicola TaxID=1850975 RepID=UPI0025459060|nr:uncharacterized protein N7511_002116 [Penicillium nucicola]KAJ5770065.1 hypothetical protein N7511_002116 [Penicillium nucicola]
MTATQTINLDHLQHKSRSRKQEYTNETRNQAQLQSRNLEPLGTIHRNSEQQKTFNLTYLYLWSMKHLKQ